jgi:hypothetical protein
LCTSHGFDVRQGFENSKHVIIAAFRHLVKQAQEAQGSGRHDGIFGVFALWGEEHSDFDAEQVGEMVETARSDAINTVFVFLDLRRADTSTFTKRYLAYALRDTQEF